MRKFLKFCIVAFLLIGSVFFCGCITITPPITAPTPTPQIVYVTVLVTPIPTIIPSTIPTSTQRISTETPDKAIPTNKVDVVSSMNGSCDCSSNKYNCADFSSHADAQACYDYCKSQGEGDVHKLDANKDGNACESLP